MSKRKRIKALPVCSETLREKCAINNFCENAWCIDGCPIYAQGGPCQCAEYIESSRGCPYFRKAGDK